MIRENRAWTAYQGEEGNRHMTATLNSTLLRTSSYRSRRKFRFRLIALILIFLSLSTIALYYITFDSRVSRTSHDAELIFVLRSSGILFGVTLVLCGLVTLWNAQKSKCQSCIAGQTIILAGLWTILAAIGWIWLERCCESDFKKRRFLAAATVAGCGITFVAAVVLRIALIAVSDRTDPRPQRLDAMPMVSVTAAAT